MVTRDTNLAALLPVVSWEFQRPKHLSVQAENNPLLWCVLTLTFLLSQGQKSCVRGLIHLDAGDSGFLLGFVLQERG